ncbi:helix-turn-helix transcriptional regulator [Thermoanaerobacterium sp. CMT5567-10]|uniref:helix-turn-helix domain-containing protein n=1 Tax=Thermoanaerobacterium sp. CMT5567-10 TaxID=3061989 RepID=UPI0026E0BBC6|nr:helix-turn-helix transcriptional regulator [Thermoanaerobacterium sp. CMT5567-10]WKV08160.1 helix-turn-helix transcriptional regulator [Thermoanaerobacterium sp. CMT5567-10]
MSIGEYIKKIREDRKLSINQLALYSNVSAAHISRIERGLREPSPEILKKISEVLDVPYEELMKIAGYLNDNINIPEDYVKKYKVTKRDLMQYEDFIQHAGAFFMNDEVAEEDKEKLFRDISELFWEAKEMNKKKYGKKKKKEEN